MKHKILLDFEIQTDHLILIRRPDLILINKKQKQNKNKTKPKKQNNNN